VPAEEGFPAADVAVGRVNAFDFGRECVREDGVEAVKVPALAGGIHQGAQQISTVQRG